MIKGFNKNEESNNIIPYIKTNNGKILNTTLVFEIDQEEFNVEEVNQFMKQIELAFPKCDIVTTFKGIRLAAVLE